MISIKTITPPDWMRSEPIIAVMDSLEGRQETPKALCVGGCVRNMLLGVPVSDIDLATQFTPEEVMKRLQAQDIKVIPTGIEHGTVTAVIEGQSFEITTLRRDVETDGRRAVTAFTTDWLEDAQRRDFTINSLLAAPDGRIFDPLGTGVQDLEARRVVFIGDPHQRIAEDVLRILRFFRFYLYYGEGEIDPAGLQACRAAADKIETLSRERVTQELFKILSHPDPAPVLKTMFENGILSDLPDAAFQMDLMQRLKTHEPLLRMFILAGLKENYFEKTLILTNAQKRTLRSLSEAYAFFGNVSEKSIKILIYKYKRDIAAQVYDVRCAKDDLNHDPQITDILRNWEVPIFPVTGEDLIKQGVPEGPELGQRLKEMEEAWIEENF